MSDTLDRAIALLTDGDVVDWEGLLEDAADTHERLLLEELRGVAQLDSEQPAPPAPTAEGSVGVPAPRATTMRRRWGHLELLEEIGRGTYGTVYRAWDTRLAREVGASWEEILGSIMLTVPGHGLLPAVASIPHARRGYEEAREAEQE